MGLNGALTIMSLNEFEAFRDGRDEGEAGREECFDIQRLWFGFHTMLQPFGPPLSLAINGDYQPAGCPPDLQSFVDDSYPSDFYIACASPRLVTEISQQFVVLAEQRVNDLLHQLAEGVQSYYDDYQRYFRVLRQAYSEAAKENAALLITVC